MLAKDNLNEALADAVMDRPRELFIGSKRYCLWSPSLGMSLMIERHIAALGIDNGLLERNPAMEALRLVGIHRKEVAHILAILSFRQYSELCQSEKIRKRAEVFADKLSDEEMAQLILVVLTEPTAQTLISLSDITKDHAEQSRIVKYKNRDGHTVSFGGKTIYGTLIDAACSRYGWTKEYVVWGIDLVSLQTILADTINSICLSDEEMKALGIHSTHDQKFGMTPEDIARLKAMDWS